LKSEGSQEKQLNNGTNLVEVSQTLLRIVARLSKNEYTESNSTKNGRQATELELDNLSDPASEVSTSQG